MSLYTYTNQAGQSFPLREQALEPKDYWEEKPLEPCEEEYDRWEEEGGDHKNRRCRYVS